MIYVGPYMNRLFNIRASVMMMRQGLATILLFIFLMATKKMNLAITSWLDWKYKILCGKSKSMFQRRI